MAEALLALSAVYLECSRPAKFWFLDDAVLMYRVSECRPGGMMGKLSPAREQFVATLRADVGT